MAVVAVPLALLAACGTEASADAERFCEVDRELEQLADFTTVAPDDARALVTQTRDLLDEAEDVAPDEISSAVAAVADSFRVILDFYDDADYDVDEAEFSNAIDSGELPVDPPEAADLGDWVAANCEA